MNKKSNYNRFMLLWSGQLISAIGSGLTSFGLGIYVFQKTGSAASMALVALMAFLPTLLLSAPAGVLADRYDRRLLMMAGDGLSALGLVYILICMLRGSAELYQICILLFGSLADSIDSLMTEAKTPDFLQMHTGDLDESSISDFAGQRNDIEAIQNQSREREQKTIKWLDNMGW